MEKWIEAWRVDEVLHDAWVNRPLDSDRWVIGDIQKALADMPAADVAPVRRGKWIPHREESREYIGTVLVSVRYDYWFCDACGYRVKNGQPMYNFCPNCGARMDG